MNKTLWKWKEGTNRRFSEIFSDRFQDHYYGNCSFVKPIVCWFVLVLSRSLNGPEERIKNVGIKISLNFGFAGGFKDGKKGKSAEDWQEGVQIWNLDRKGSEERKGW
jgi:hypothetical protein